MVEVTADPALPLGNPRTRRYACRIATDVLRPVTEGDSCAEFQRNASGSEHGPTQPLGGSGVEQGLQCVAILLAHFGDVRLATLASSHSESKGSVVMKIYGLR